jgi:hypothetical protein
MNFEVLWSAEAESRLANAWLLAPNRHQVTEAAARIDEMLRRDPEDIGESRPGGRRIVHEPPLGLVFSVDVENQRVLVLDLWCYDVHDE